MDEQKKSSDTVVGRVVPAAGTGVTQKVEEPVMMEVSVAKMQDMLIQMDNMKVDIAALNATVSDVKLKEAKAVLEVDKRPRVHFKKVKGKVVIGWPETVGEDKKNELIYSATNPGSPVGEILKCRYYYIDGTKSDMLDQIELTRSTDQVFARVIQDLGNSAIMEFEDKSVAVAPIEIHKKFWNA